MARIVLIHGVGWQFDGDEVLRQQWTPYLQSGLHLAGSGIDSEDIAAACYGDLFRPSGVMAADLPPYTDADLDPAIYQDLLLQLWDAAAQAQPETIMPPSAQIGR